MKTINSYLSPDQQSVIKDVLYRKKIEREFKELGLDPNKLKIEENHDLIYDGNINLRNKNLTSLPSCFEKLIEVGGYFSCHSNELTSLEFAPEKVGGGFYCDNNKLTSLEGAPTEVGKSFSCCNNKLTSLKDAPKKVGEDFYCSHNKKKFTKEEVRKVCEVVGEVDV